MTGSKIAVRRTYTEVDGGALAQALTTSWLDGGDIAIEAASAFDPHGGVGWFTQGVLERFRYREVRISPTENGVDYLVGVTRPDPQNHRDGSFIQAGDVPVVRKFYAGNIDGSERISDGVEVRPQDYGWLPANVAFADEDVPIIALERDEDYGQWAVGAPIGAIPTFDEDLEVLPVEAIVTSDLAFDFILDTVTPIGAGDGAAPTAPGSAPTIITGPRTNVVDMRAYSKPSDYFAMEVEVSTNGGSSWTSLGETSDVFAHANLTIGAVLRYRYKVHDSEGNVTAASPATADYTVVGTGTADLVAGSVTASILASIITIANTFQTASSGSRVMFDGSGIRLIDGSGNTVMNLNAGTGIATLVGAVYKSALSNGRVELDASGLRFYNPAGTLIVELDTSDGSASFVGTIASGSLIESPTVTGGIIRTAATGSRMEVNQAVYGPRINFLLNSTLGSFVEGGISSGVSFLGLSLDAGYQVAISLTDNLGIRMFGDVLIQGTPGGGDGDLAIQGSKFGFSTGPEIIVGSGAPGGVVSASPGSLYLRTNGTAYLKTSGTGTSGWNALLT